MPSPNAWTPKSAGKVGYGPRASRRASRWGTWNGGRKAPRTGTTITFVPDPEIFQETRQLSYATVASRLRELAYLNRNLRIRLTDARRSPARSESFRYQGGIRDFVAHLNRNNDAVNRRQIVVEDQDEEAELEVALQWTAGYQENVLSFVNNISTVEGGTHEEGFRRALTKVTNDFGRAKNLIKEKDSNLTGEDVREGLTAVLSVRVKNPQFEGQTKTKLGNTEIRSYVEKGPQPGVAGVAGKTLPGSKGDRDQGAGSGQGPGGGPQGAGVDTAQITPRVHQPSRQAGGLLEP